MGVWRSRCTGHKCQNIEYFFTYLPDDYMYAETFCPIDVLHWLFITNHKDFFLFYFFNIWRWFLIRQTKFEFVQNWENMNFSSALLSLLKIFCIWEILALLRIYSLFENICVLLVLSVCCLLENSKVHIIQHSLPFWHIPVSRDQTQSPWGAWEVGSTSRAHHP